MKESHLPEEFINRLRDQLGDELGLFLKEHANPAPVSVRMNPFKLSKNFEKNELVPWATNAFYLPERISFTHDPLFHAGCYYVQEASSMFLEQALSIAFADKQKLRVLDLCAAPGGKSTHIASLLTEGSLLVSNEVISSRNKILQQNITKWGVANVVVTQNEPADFSKLEGFFDVIVVDAPCSGEGLFRKDPDAIDHWSIENVTRCVNRQQNILHEIYPALKEGGYLIYSTCTYEEQENEFRLKQMADEFNMLPVAIPFDVPGSVKSEFGTRFYPHKIKGEGFFLGMLQKSQAQHAIAISKPKSVKNTEFNLEPYLENSQNFISFIKNSEVYAFPVSVYPEIKVLLDKFFVRKAGIHIGALKGKDLIPSQELAMSIDSSKSIEKITISKEDAITYLSCDAINPVGIKKGWALIAFENFTLGWIKSLGNRSNNYYPKEWRILTKVK